MDSDVFRQPAGAAASTGGRFATKHLSETGTVLAAPVPEWGAERRAELAAELDEHLEHVRVIMVTEGVLRHQRTAAWEAQRDAVTVEQARAAGADLGEVEFMQVTADMERRIARADVLLTQARIEVDKDAGAAVKACLNMRSGTVDPAGQSAMLIRALDLDSDLGAGHIGWHPWKSETRTEKLQELNDYIDALPTDPDVPLWTEQLLQLGDPFRVRRVELAVRHSPTPANQAQLALTRAAEKENDGYTNEQPTSSHFDD